MLAIAAASPVLCEHVSTAMAAAAAEGNGLGASFARDPGWVVNRVLRHDAGDVRAASLTTLHGAQLAELKLGKRTETLVEEAEALHGRLDRYAFGGPRFEFSEADVDQARVAGVRLELGTAPLVIDRARYRELAKNAVAHTAEELRARVASQVEERTAARRSASAARERTPAEELEVEHRAQAREFATRAGREPGSGKRAARRARGRRSGRRQRRAVLRPMPTSA